jgi:flagellar protein FlaG
MTRVNTENVQPLSVTATKPASNASSAQKRTTASPIAEQALISKPSGRVSEMRTVQQAAAAAARQIESYLRSVGRQIQFSIDSASGRTVVSIRDAGTGDVIRQMPSEEALRLAQALGSQTSSLLDVVV